MACKKKHISLNISTLHMFIEAYRSNLRKPVWIKRTKHTRQSQVQNLCSKSPLLLVHKYYYHKHLLPKIYHDYFQPNQGMYSYDTRNKATLHLLSVNTIFGQRLSSLKALCYGMSSLTTLKIFVLLTSSNIISNRISNKIIYWNNC